MILWLAEIWRAWRASLRKPGFLLLASGVLALGIGASVAVFTLIDQTLLQPVPYAAAGRLVALGPMEQGEIGGISPQQYQHMQPVRGLASLGLIRGDVKAVNVAGAGEPEQVDAFLADRGLLSTLGVRMRLGRDFSAQEDRPGGPRAVILSEGYWRRRYGAATSAIGQNLIVEGVPRTIVGVLPASFDQFGQGDLMLPLALAPDTYDDGTNFLGVGRLAQGNDAAVVGARIDAAMHAMYAQIGDSTQLEYWSHERFGTMPLLVALHQQQRPTLMLFLASALCVLLIALVNLGNLMLLRTASRQHDATVRHALGAPAWRLAVPACAEGVLVGTTGAVAGIGLAVAGLSLFGRFVPADWTHGEVLRMSPGVMVLALAVAMTGALAAALFGVWRGLASTSVREALHDGGRSPSRSGGRLGRGLVMAQVSLATCLLCGAGLFLHTLYDAARTPLGFSSDHVLTFDLAPVAASHPDVASTQALVQLLLQRLRAVPGVERVAVTNGLPAGDFGQQFQMGGVHAVGQDYLRPGPQIRGVNPGFFSVFRMAVYQGRAFGTGDRAGSEPVAIVNRTLAEQVYAGHALGKEIVVNDYSGYPGVKADAADAAFRPVTARIVGVVGDTRQFGPLDGRKRAFVYLPLAQMPEHILHVFRSFQPLRFALRVQGDPDGYRKAVHAAISEVAPQQPIANLRTMDAIVHATTDETRRDLFLIGLFALLAWGLAAAGMYAVMTVAVTARQREFAVRMALGAPPLGMVGLVLRSGLRQIVAGLALGVGIALALAQVLRAVLQELGRSAFDPFALAGVCAALALAGLLACMAPAIRAGRTAPMRALRGE